MNKVKAIELASTVNNRLGGGVASPDEVTETAWLVRIGGTSFDQAEVEELLLSHVWVVDIESSGERWAFSTKDKAEEFALFEHSANNIVWREDDPDFADLRDSFEIEGTYSTVGSIWKMPVR